MVANHISLLPTLCFWCSTMDLLSSLRKAFEEQGAYGVKLFVDGTIRQLLGELCSERLDSIFFGCLLSKGLIDENTHVFLVSSYMAIDYNIAELEDAQSSEQIEELLQRIADVLQDIVDILKEARKRTGSTLST